jgi:predicted ATPase
VNRKHQILLSNPNLLRRKFLIFHFDNLQWADKDSLNFLEQLALSSRDNLLVILSNRPAQKALSAAEIFGFYKNIEAKTELFKIEIDTFSLASLRDVLKSVFPFSESDYERLATISFENSNGNPSVLYEFFSSLSRSGHLKFELELGKWNWVLADGIDFTLPRLLIDRLENLGEMQRLVIQSSACFGSNLNIPFVSRITNLDQSEIQYTYREAIKIGFIVPVGVNNELDLSDLTNFKFSNETIQEAVHSSLFEIQRHSIHQKIADYYIENSLIGLDTRDVFECAYHLNEAIHNESSFDEKLAHAQVNMNAAEKALSSASFSLALNYLQQAMDSNLHHNWTSAYALASQVRIKGYQIARITNNISLANKRYAQGVENCFGLDVSELRFAKINLDIQFGELQAALDTGLVALKELAVKVPGKAGILTVVKELVKTKIMLFNKSPKKIVELEELTDTKTKFAIKVMICLFKSAYYLNPELNAVLALKILQLTLRK